MKTIKENSNPVFSVLQNLKEERECDLPKGKGIPLMPKRLPNSFSTRRSKKEIGKIPLPKRKTSLLKIVDEAREKFIGSTDLKITEERKRVENENVLVEYLVDGNVNCDSVPFFNVDITNKSKVEDLDESVQTNETISITNLGKTFLRKT